LVVNGALAISRIEQAIARTIGYNVGMDVNHHRRRIQQLVSNEFPGCTAVFQEGAAVGLNFRIRAKNGRFRCATISAWSNTRLSAAWLKRALKFNRGPAVETRRKRVARAAEE
jgi:hypothetical protein